LQQLALGSQGALTDRDPEKSMRRSKKTASPTQPPPLGTWTTEVTLKALGL
jgi:hypothetical protein